MKHFILSILVLSGSYHHGLLGQIPGDLQNTLTEYQDSYPFISEDGSQLVFHSNRTGNNEIYLYHVDSGKLQQLTFDISNDRTPSLSPDKSSIAFVSTREGNYDIFVMGADGSNPVNLTKDVASKDIHPYWTPNGQQIIFNSTNKGANYDLFLMNKDGTDRKKLRSSNGEATHGQVSPSGEKVVFRQFFRDSGASNSEIVILDLATFEETRITDHVGFDNYPFWSGTGQHILFSSSRNGIDRSQMSIYAYEVVSEQLTSVISSDKDRSYIGYSMDDKLVLYLTETNQSVTRIKTMVLPQ